MIRKVSHQNAGRGPADVTVALEVAQELQTPAAPPATPAPRAPEIAPAPVPQLMGLRTSADRPHRRKVPLHRLTTMRSLAVLGA
ncbi:hypothetical protein [Streptomyces sp. AF1A]|jgi:hypothetical protein|uniref:hypothetical protein n=1 Tax=Streptomyces sp. AF1A TaxID=3394350 RepID=UPI0039BD10E7